MLLGVMDDALLANVPDVAFPAVQQLHPQVIRYDLSWAHTAPRKPADATNPDDPAYDWSLPDTVVTRADALGVPVMLTIEVTPTLGRRRNGQQGARQHGLAAGVRVRRGHPLQRPAHRSRDGPGAAGRDALGGLERAQHDEPPDAAVQLPLRDRAAGRAGIYAKILKAIYIGVHSAGTHAGVKEDRRRRRHEAQLLRAEDVRAGRRAARASCSSCWASGTRRSTSTRTIPTARTSARRPGSDAESQRHRASPTCRG